MSTQSATVELNKLARVATERAPETIERALSVAREALGMDVAFASEFVAGKEVYRSLEGDAESFGFREGKSVPLAGTFCQRVVEGRLPNAVPDVRNDERVKDLSLTREADIGSYVGVPLRLSDGRLYGTLCVLSHSPEPALRERDVGFMRVLARFVAEQLERDELEAEKRRLQVESAGLQALLAAIEARDNYAGDHCRTVLELAVRVARRLGLPEREVQVVRQGALLHDVGKIAIPDSILKKPGPLDEKEWEVMHRHPEIGARMIASVRSLTHLAPVIRAAHERWDGMGYPDGLQGEQIPLASRIIFTCDAWHAMTSDRPYREALGVQRKIQELRENVGSQFDPRVVSGLAEVLKIRHLLPPDEAERIISEALARGAGGRDFGPRGASEGRRP